MSNYKKIVRITGNKYQLQAFVNEVIDKGYRASRMSSIPPCEQRPILQFFKDGSFGTFKTTDCLTQEDALFSLPKEWNEALAAIQEKEEEPIKVGDWIDAAKINPTLSTVWGLVTKIEDHRVWTKKPYGTSENWMQKENARKISDKVVLENFKPLLKERGFEGKKLAIWPSPIDLKIAVDFSESYFSVSGTTLSYQGRWIWLAEYGWVKTAPIEEELTMLGYTADFSCPGIVKFGCQTFGKTEIEMIAKFLGRDEISPFITISDKVRNTISKDFLEKVLARIK